MNEIGVGSYGRVYTVLSQKYKDVIFAAKVMTLEGSSVCVFDTEIEILSNLSHPHILSLFDTFRVDNDCVLILEYCSNGTISQYIHAQQFPSAHIITLLKLVVYALSYCHSLGVALRDIKPNNILIDHYGRPKLADFGLSCFVKCPDGPKCAGSLSYMAPELFNMADSTDLFSADIWSLGITFYQLFVGELPWPKRTNHNEMIRIIVSMIPEIPESLAPRVRAILGRMIMADPKARATAADLLHDEIFANVEQKGVIGVRSLDGTTRRMARAITPAREGMGQKIFLGRPSVPNLPYLKRGSEQNELGKLSRIGEPEVHHNVRRYSFGTSTGIHNRKI
jgi:serine/threonine protein kinase